MEVTLFREDIPLRDVLFELIGDADQAIRFDCAGDDANFEQPGWFICPRGSLKRNMDVTSAA